MLKKLYVTLLMAFGLTFASAMATPSSASALFESAKQDACSGTQLSDKDGANCNPQDAKKINDTLDTAVNILSIIVGVAAVIVILVNGFRFVVSNGDSNAVSGAKKGILYAVIGLVIVALAQFIVKFVLTKVT